MLYDLDKTQEWLNRTLAIGKAPPIRGGIRPDRKARRTTAISLAATALVILLGILIAPWLRSAPVADVVVPKHDANDRRPVVRMSQASPTVHQDLITRPAIIHPLLVGLDSSTPDLDGGIRPLPGHAAPPAPVYLDGPSPSGMLR